MRAPIAILVLAAGCSTSDPCDGVTGICLSARVEGQVSGLDQLRVSLATLPNMVLSPATPSSFSLPVKLAIVFPASATGSADLTIEGLQGGRSIATTGRVSIMIPASGRFARTFTLSGGAPGDGGGDGPNGDGGQDGAVDGSADLSNPDQGHVFTWQNETPPGATGYYPAVWGSSSADVYIGGSAMMPGSLGGPAQIFHSTGDGTWTAAQFQPAANGNGVTSIWGSGPGDVHAVGDFGIWHSTAGGPFIKQLGAQLLAIWGSSATSVYACGPSGIFSLGAGGVWGSVSITSSDAGTFQCSALGGANGNVYAFGPSGGSTVIYQLNGTQFVQVPFSAGFNLPPQGVWSTSSVVVMVGADSVPAGKVAYFAPAQAMLINDPTFPTAQFLNGVSGTFDPVGTRYDVWVVGGDTTRIYHGNGNFPNPPTWTPVSLPGTVTAEYGVWAAPDGQVYATGTFGAVAHLK